MVLRYLAWTQPRVWPSPEGSCTSMAYQLPLFFSISSFSPLDSRLYTLAPVSFFAYTFTPSLVTYSVKASATAGSARAASSATASMTVTILFIIIIYLRKGLPVVCSILSAGL